EIRELDQMAVHICGVGAQLEHSEAQRMQTHQRLELVLESATESLWEIRYETGLVKLRGRICERLGLASELPLEQFFQRIHPDDVPHIREAHLQLSQGACDSYSSEFRFADSPGQYHWLLRRGMVLEKNPESGV